MDALVNRVEFGSSRLLICADGLSTYFNILVCRLNTNFLLFPIQKNGVPYKMEAPTGIAFLVITNVVEP